MKNSQYVRQAQYKKGFVVPLLLAIIAVLIIGGGVYIYNNKKAEAPVVIDTGTQQTDTQTSPVNTQTNNSSWKTYTNDERFYEFRYPEYGKISTAGGLTSETVVELTSNYGVSFAVTTTSPGQISLCSGNPYSNSYLDTTGAKVVENKIQKDGDEYRHFSMINSESVEDRYYKVKNNICYMIVERTLYPNKVDSKIKIDLDKILSTFKFTK